MKNIERHALAVMALITAALGQQQSDSLSAIIEKTQALDKEALRVSTPSRLRSIGSTASIRHDVLSSGR